MKIMRKFFHQLKLSTNLVDNMRTDRMSELSQKSETDNIVNQNFA